ncbi:MAG: type II toxin-antitoxin system RelE/ParE family toxin [Pseudomonadota bacterium]
MAASLPAVHFTANFERNLEQIAAFWSTQDAPQAYANLLDALGDTVIGNLEQHPRIGRRFFARLVQSVEAQARILALRKRFGDAEVREYLSGDYLLLYCIAGEAIYLLAIRHHRQLSFDFDGFWQAPRGQDG